MRRDPTPPSDRRPDVPGRAPAWRRRIHRHRAVIGAALAGVLVWSLTSALRPAPPEQTAVLVAAHDIAPGTVLAEADVALEQRPSQAVPRDAAGSAAELVGRTVVVPLLQGDALLSRHLLGSSLLSGYGADVVATPVRLSDDAAAAVVHPGDVVDVVAAVSGDVTAGGSGSAVVVASGVRVLLAGSGSASTDTGLLSAASSGGSPSVLVLATTTAQGLAIARAAVGARLSVMLRSR